MKILKDHMLTVFTAFLFDCGILPVEVIISTVKYFFSLTFIKSKIPHSPF